MSGWFGAGLSALIRLIVLSLALNLVSNLIGVFQDKDLDLSNNRAADDDLIGDAYEYLCTAKSADC